MAAPLLEDDYDVYVPGHPGAIDVLEREQVDCSSLICGSATKTDDLEYVSPLKMPRPPISS